MASRLVERVISPAGAAALVAVALASYGVQALAWPLQRGRDSWDYWLTFLQLADTEPPFSALQVFRTPIAPLVTGIPMWLGGAALAEVVFGVLYALSILGWAWAVAPLSRAAALATALVLLVTPTYAGLFHEVSSDHVFALLVAWWAGAVVRAFSTGSTTWLAAVGGGVALLTLCRPAAQVLLLATVLVPLLARRHRTPILRGLAVCLAAAIVPLAAWALHNAARYDDLTVARGGKAWVPFFRVGGDVDPRNGDASRRLAEAVEREVLTLPPYASRRVDVETYFGGVGNLEVIRLIALSDRVFGRDDDYDVLFDASLETIRTEPWAYVRGVADTFRDFLSQRYAPEVRERPVRFASLPAELSVDGEPFPAPVTVSPLVPAIRYGFVWCPTDDLERCVVRNPLAALGDASEARRYDELVDTIRDWNAQLPTRDSNAWLASKGGTASDRWPRPFLWVVVAALALAVRRPRGTMPVLVLLGSATVVLLVHALSQAPQSEFQLPFVPLWIAAVLVGLLAPRKRAA
ncbi:MAG: hypothetical protein H0W16_06745 [Actinobacteria bacterium]|nr:hypothetical protein [Actinomycetota bacterium]